MDRDREIRALYAELMADPLFWAVVWRFAFVLVMLGVCFWLWR